MPFHLTRPATLWCTAGALAALAFAVPATATLPTPSDAAAPRQAQAFLFKAGAGDIFEIVTSQMAVQRSASPAVKAFATMRIADHTGPPRLRSPRPGAPA